jgi:two-component system phosphate regulon sensor histidine kinase PhoR
MKEITPIQVAGLAASIVGGGALVGLFVVHIFVVSIPWWLIPVGAVVTGLIAFAAFYYALELFINSKIKVIYKTIHAIKSPAFIRSGEVNLTEDALGKINREVQDWADSKIHEIRELRQRDDFRKEFIGNLAHELKTPIFNIQGYILTLVEGALDDPEINQQFLLRASKSVDRMIMIINDLDTISQFESGQLQLKLQRTNIVHLTQEVLEGLELNAKKRKVNLRIEHDLSKPIWVKIDPFRIGQVLTNLISNAVNYGKQGGNCVISFFDMDKHILVEVADDGPGIEPHHLPRLFERFYRVDKSRAKHAGGTGLGLAITKHILEAHGQSINVRSKVGEGTTMSFTLERA